MDAKEFSNRKPGIIGQEKCRQYGILVPIIEIEGIQHLLFEKRGDRLRKHPGEICFPGGKLEEGETVEECAIRETMEELLVSKDQIKILGPGDVYVSPFNLMVHPFIGSISDFRDTFSKEEVESLIKIPLDFFFHYTPEKFVSQLINQPASDFPYERIPGGTEYPWATGTYDILFYHYENHTIWGMTALILRSVIALISEGSDVENKAKETSKPKTHS